MGSVKRVPLTDYTASLIYGACQCGLQVNADEMSPNLLMAIADYAAKQNSSEEEIPAMSLAELRRAK